MKKSWRYHAFCFGANPEIFDDPAHTETAKAYCLRCPVSDMCLAEAILLGPSTEGTWGGTTQDERAALKRGGHRVSCPGCGGQSVFNDGSSEICVSCGLSWRA